MGEPYRDHALARAPVELEFAPAELAATNSSHVAAVQFVAPAFATALVVGLLTNVWLALLGGVVAFVASRVLGRRRRPITFRVEAGRLWIGRGKAVLFRGTLDDLLDVELATRTIKLVREGSSLVPATRFTNLEVGPALDRSRLFVVLCDQRIPLSDDELSHTEATEWAGRLRVFLRKQGWLPLDERPAAPQDES